MIRGTFLGIEIAKRGIFSASVGLDTTSHNIANANTEGYSRQRAVQKSSFPLAYPGPFITLRPGQIGTGTEITSITRIRSDFIEAQIHRETGGFSMYAEMSEYFLRIEDIVGEPSEHAIGGLMEDFFNAWEDLGNDPESTSARTNLAASATALTNFVNEVDQKLDLELIGINEQLRERIDRLNNLAHQVADLNSQIVQMEGGGQSQTLKANDLKDHRDLLIEEMSNLVNARVLFNNDGSVSVLVQGHPIVGGQNVSEVSLQPDPNDPFRPTIVFSKSRIPLEINSGEINGLLRIRDEEIPTVRNNIGLLISTFTNRVNEMHRRGYGLDGLTNRPFFMDTETRRISGTIPLPPGTTLDTTLEDLGISSGDFFVQGEHIVITDNEVLPGQSLTLGQVFDRIMEVNNDVRLEIDMSGGFPRVILSQFNPVNADSPLSIKQGSSDFLSVLGLATAPVVDIVTDPRYENAMQNFSLHPTIKQDLDSIAATGDDGLGYPGPGDNRTALAIADLKNDQLAVFGTTLGEYYQSTIANLGSAAQNVDRSRISLQLVVDQLNARRQEISGVNLDEEAVNLIKYQKAFEACSRALTALDDILSTIINRMGIVGR